MQYPKMSVFIQHILLKMSFFIFLNPILFSDIFSHLKNEHRSRDAAAQKRANTSGVGKSNNYFN